MKIYIVWAVDNEIDFDFNVCIVFKDEQERVCNI